MKKSHLAMTLLATTLIASSAFAQRQDMSSTKKHTTTSAPNSKSITYYDTAVCYSADSNSSVEIAAAAYACCGTGTDAQKYMWALSTSSACAASGYSSNVQQSMCTAATSTYPQTSSSPFPQGSVSSSCSFS